ncbi:hypothetical protein GGX14DRAFT_580390 [Mycena pura]|uniref:Uncharacterized protein n=1 Tax=Mycena pura TaxID=153505 RepID=A0AAD6UP12_9AGAR|nr:hypothetical protein GGX14DRAFT_580390 [Mycena pura]
MDLSELSPMFRAPTPTSDSSEGVDDQIGPAPLPERPPYLYPIGEDPLFYFARDENGKFIWPELVQYVASHFSPRVGCLIRLPATVGGCGRCFLRGLECTFTVRGDACPPCLAGCHECSFADPFVFLEALALFRDTGYAQQTSPAECEAFLTRFYSDAKAAFMIFDRNVQRSQSAIESGYTALLNGITDPTILNLITILAAALDVSPVVVGLLRHRSMELSIDFDGLFTKAIELIDAWKARRARN